MRTLTSERTAEVKHCVGTINPMKLARCLVVTFQRDHPRAELLRNKETTIPGQKSVLSESLKMAVQLRGLACKRRAKETSMNLGER